MKSIEEVLANITWQKPETITFMCRTKYLQLCRQRTHCGLTIGEFNGSEKNKLQEKTENNA